MKNEKEKYTIGNIVGIITLAIPYIYGLYLISYKMGTFIGTAIFNLSVRNKRNRYDELDKE